MTLTLVKAWTAAKDRLKDAGIDQPSIDARLMLEVAADVTRTDIVTDPYRELTAEQQATLEDYLAQMEFIRTRGLIHHIPPIQLAIRLLVPPGSALLTAPDCHEWLGELEAEAFTYRWTHLDSRMDRLYEQVSDRVGEAESTGEAPEQTLTAISSLVFAK